MDMVTTLLDNVDARPPTYVYIQHTYTYIQAAAKGHAGAMGDLGIMYALGSEAQEGPHGLPVRGMGLPQDLDLVRDRDHFGL